MPLDEFQKRFPNCSVSMADQNGVDVLSVWKWKGQREWIPFDKVLDQIFVIGDSVWILHEIGDF